MATAVSIPSRLGSDGPRVFDFKVVRLKERDWQIAPISQRALSWARANFGNACSAEDGALHTDLSGVNSFLSRARNQGFETEYCGPNSTIAF